MELGRKWVAAAIAPVARIAQALLVSRQSLYKPRLERHPVPRPQPRPVICRWIWPLTSSQSSSRWKTLWSCWRAGTWHMGIAACGRNCAALATWSIASASSVCCDCGAMDSPDRVRIPRPRVVTAPNQLWQTDITAIWCGEDGWAYLTAVLDCFDCSILGWSFTPRCRARDFSPAAEQAWSTAWPYGPSTAPSVVLRHDNGTQFTSEHYREVAARLGIRLSRTRYRHPDGNAFVERIFLSLKQEEVWPQDYGSFREALQSVSSWIVDYNRQRPHQSLKYRTPAEVREEALGSTQSAA